MMRAFVFTLLCACGAGQKPTEDLVAAVRTFEEGLRWRRFEQAADMVPHDERTQFMDRREELDAELRIDDYEIERVTIAPSHAEAEVQVKYTWHKNSVGTVHETVVTDRWQKEGSTWRVIDSTHKRGEPMPK